ncbi:hypothetical protein [Aquimarina latercula]|uniref:hypothetical protein n=1 Tax=Aquimarina latercula TaxID=987 RepID=UPI000480CDE0|nr:hypothetical protein [Aquimarina latercula]
MNYTENNFGVIIRIVRIMNNICKLVVILIVVVSCARSDEGERRALFACLEKGKTISKLIMSSKAKKINKTFTNTPNVDYLVEIMDEEVMKHEKYMLSHPNIFYNPYGDEYIYTIYASKWIDNGTDWGLNDYLFVIQLAFKYDEDSKKISVENSRILKDHIGFKKWWYSFMRSYKEQACRRNLWAETYNLIPPSPPPPAIEDWISKR